MAWPTGNNDVYSQRILLIRQRGIITKVLSRWCDSIFEDIENAYIPFQVYFRIDNSSIEPHVFTNLVALVAVAEINKPQ